MEHFISGYCRALDAARTVLLEDGEADCAWPACPFAEACSLAAQMKQWAEGENCGL